MSRYLPVLERGCFCCNLEFCCIFQGCFGILQAGLGIAMGGFVVSMASEQPDYLDAALAVGIGYIIISVFIAIACVLFLIGIRKRRAHLLRPYVILLYLSVAGVAVKLFLYIPNGNEICLAGLSLGGYSYMLLCANSLLVTMERETSLTDIAQSEPLKVRRSMQHEENDMFNHNMTNYCHMPTSV